SFIVRGKSDPLRPRLTGSAVRTTPPACAARTMRASAKRMAGFYRGNIDVRFHGFRPSARATPRSDTPIARPRYDVGMTALLDMQLTPIAVIRSTLVDRRTAPMQGSEGAPDAWLEVDAAVADALAGIAVGDELLIITWFHQANRDVLRVHPRDDA